MANSVTEFKSSAEQVADAERSVRISALKDKLTQYGHIQRHLTTARKRYVAELSDERYAAAGYVGDPEHNLIEAVGKLHDIPSGATVTPSKESIQ